MELSTSSPTDHPRVAGVGKTNRSRVSNGKDLLAGVDQRTAVYRRYRDIIAAITVDQGGVAQCSESRKQLIRRFSACSVLAEQAEAKLAAGEEIDIAQFALLSSTLTRLVSRLGINRVAKDVGPTLGELLRADLDRQAGG